MTHPNREYFEFYLNGRDDIGDDDPDIENYDELAKRVLDGEDVRVVAYEAATELAKKLTDDGMENWRKSSRRTRKDIEAAGGDTKRAYDLYIKGVVDGVASVIEDEILEVIANDDLPEDDEGEETDKDEDDEETD